MVRIVEGWVVDRALPDYMLLPKRIRERLLDVIVCRGEGEGMCAIFWSDFKYEVLRGGDLESGEKEWEKLRYSEVACTNDG